MHHNLHYCNLSSNIIGLFTRIIQIFKPIPNLPFLFLKFLKCPPFSNKNPPPPPPPSHFELIEDAPSNLINGLKCLYNHVIPTPNCTF